MRPITFAATLLLLSVSLQSSAQQVYKTTDAQGNTVFTDVPPEAGAEAVPLQTPNIADSVEVRPPEPSPAEPTIVVPDEAVPEAPAAYTGTDDDLREDVYEARRQQALREKAREEAGAPVAKPLPAGPRPAGKR